MIPLTSTGLFILVLAVIAIFLLPRRWAPAPLLLVACYMVLSQGVKLGPFHFFSIRLVILAGLVRIVLRREYLGLRVNAIDKLMAIFAVWAVTASFLHLEWSDTLTYNSGLVFNSFGVYLLLRAFSRSVEDIDLLCRIVILLLVPVAIEMVYEKVAASNLFSVLGGVPDIPNIREGRIRAQGPFAHSILGGTVGAVVLPIALGMWGRHRRMAVFGGAACITIVLASASSGPLMSAIVSVIALMVWRFRRHMKVIRWLIVLTYVFLEVVMKVPPYYLLARIDLSGGSTGYHRARLIESAFDHLGEWWLAGTDYTRHWMVTGVTWSPNHTDITNHYLLLGVQGGLPLTLLFIAILYNAFSIVGKAVHYPPDRWRGRRFFFWSLGASLFAHAATCISVSYFDQSFVFLYVTIAAIASLGSRLAAKPRTSKAPFPVTRSMRGPPAPLFHRRPPTRFERDGLRSPKR